MAFDDDEPPIPAEGEEASGAAAEIGLPPSVCSPLLAGPEAPGLAPIPSPNS